MKPIIALIGFAALAGLTGCGSKEGAQAEGSNFAEVLPGSASDAMPPYDTASSSPPLAAPSLATPSDPGSKPKAKAQTTDVTEIAPEAEPT